MRLSLAALATCAAFVLAQPAAADLGDLDPTFGTEGLATVPATTCSQCTGHAARLLLQPDGKTVVMSHVVSGFRGGIYDFGVYVSRLMPDGSIDGSFNGGASRYVMGGDWQSERFGDPGGGIGLQDDGKIVVADRISSACQSFYCDAQLGVARLMPDGTLDPAFGTGGIARHDTVGRSVAGLGIRPDGRIVVAVRGGSTVPFSVYRLGSDGALDSTFGNAGVATVAMPGDDGNPFFAGAFALLPDGRMVIARYVNLTLGRLLPDGAPDTTFNGSGFATFALQGAAMLARPDGSVFLGTREANSTGRIIKVAPNGQPDAAWGQAGVRTFGENFVLTNLGMQPDGRLIAFGSTISRAAFRRWLPDGLTDPTLRGAGYAISNVGNGGARLLGMQVAGGQVLASVDSGIGRFGGTLDVLGSNQIFVEQQFRDFLGRPGDPGGIAYWKGQLDSGAITRAELVKRFLESPEFQVTTAPIVRLYLAYFLRFPDYTGLLFWSDRARESGLEWVSYQFTGSAEFLQRYGSLDNSRFVELVYNNVLGRSPDASGLAYWRNKLDTGQMNRGQVMLAFSESAEYFGVSFNEVLATMIYVGLMRRAPDGGGFAYWVQYLDSGNSQAALIDNFVASEEYRARFYQ